MKKKEVVDKVLRTLPLKYDSKVSTLEEQDNIENMTVAELHGILNAYEMRKWLNKPSKEEATFKASKESKKYENLSKNHSENSDDEEALFIKKLDRVTGKYKGKLPLKCFGSGIIGHFASKCPYPKQDDSDEREVSKKFKKGKMGNKKKYRKIQFFTLLKIVKMKIQVEMKKQKLYSWDKVHRFRMEN